MGQIPAGLAACRELKLILVLLLRLAHRQQWLAPPHRLAHTKRQALHLVALAVVVVVMDAATRPKCLEPKATGALLLHLS